MRLPWIRPKAVEEQSFRIPFFALSAVLFALTLWAVRDEALTRRPWKAIQAATGIGPGIQQITLPQLGVADRCLTCHAAAHPGREALMRSHPPDRMGCTPCHAGEGLQTKGVNGARFDHGRDDPSWEHPLLSKPFIQSTCVHCHSEGEIPWAPLFNRGRALFGELRCGGCHSSRYGGPSVPAPPLDRLREKTSEASVLALLRDPQKARSGTRMPAFWPKEDAQRERETTAIAAFLGSVSVGEEMTKTDLPPGSADEGKVLFDSLGCRGCHALGEATKPPEEARFGPALDGIGARVSREWLERWLRKPRSIWPETRMPDLRLSDQEVSSLAAFLGAPDFKPAWSAADPALVAAGREAVLKYGCTGCHRIPGVSAAGRAGPDLDEFGDIPAERRVWGDAKQRCAGSERECWTLAKVKTPRAFRGHGLEPLMPEYPLGDEEARALSVFLLANRDAPAVPRLLDAKARAIAAGEQVLSRHNCRGCHEIGRDGDRPIGGQVARFFPEPALAPPPLTFAGKKLQTAWLIDFLRQPRPIRPWLTARMPTFDLEESELEALAHAFAARNDEPYPFDARARPVLNEADRADAQVLFEKLQCAKCHALGSVRAAERAPDLALAANRLKAGWIRDWLLEPQSLQPGTRMPSYFPREDEDDPKSVTTPFPDLLGGDVTRQIDALVAITQTNGAAP